MSIVNIIFEADGNGYDNYGGNTFVWEFAAGKVTWTYSKSGCVYTGELVKEKLEGTMSCPGGGRGTWWALKMHD